MDSIVAAIVKSLDMSHNHLVSTSFIPLQRQGEVWQQTLQSQAEKFAQVLLQSEQLKKEQKNQSSFNQKGQGAIQQVTVIMPFKKKLKLIIAASGRYGSEKVTAASFTRRDYPTAPHFNFNEATTAKFYY
jgi:hypothetical protein